MADLSDGTRWFETDGANNLASPNGWPEGMMPSGVNDSARNDKGALKRFWDRINPVHQITPAAGVWSFTTSNAAYPASYIEGETYTFLASAYSAGGDQFQVNALAAKPIWKFTAGGWAPIAAQDIGISTAPHLVYNQSLNGGSGAFILLNPYVPIAGDGAGGVTASNINASGTVFAANVSATGQIGGGSLVTPGNANVSGTVTAAAANISGALNAGAIGATGNISTVSGTVTAAQLTSTGNVSAIGYQARAGTPGPFTGNYVNVEWRSGGQAHLWIDNVDQGQFALIAGGTLTVPAVNATGTVTAAQLTSTGNISASSGTVTAAQLTSTGNINASANVIGANLLAGSSVYVSGQPALSGTTPGRLDILTPSGDLAVILYGSPTWETDYWNNSHKFGNSGRNANYALFNVGGCFNNSGTWGTFSDASLKEDITPYDYRGLEAILELSPVSFRYLADTPFADPERTLRYGLVAQDVARVIPEMVGETAIDERDPLKTMYPGHLVYVLVNALKELHARLAALEADVARG